MRPTPISDHSCDAATTHHRDGMITPAVAGAQGSMGKLKTTATEAQGGWGHRAPVTITTQDTHNGHSSMRYTLLLVASVK